MELDSLKASTSLTLTNFFKEIGKEESAEVVPLKYFVDPTISMMQNEAVKRINSIHTKNSTKMLELENQKAAL